MRPSRKSALQTSRSIACMLIIVAFTGCTAAETATPNIPATSTAMGTTVPTHPSAAPTRTTVTNSTPEPILPFGITLETRQGLDRRASVVDIQWEKSIKDLETGEYILVRSRCPEQGECYEIRAYSVADQKDHLVVRFNKNPKWDSIFLDNYFILAEGEIFNTLEVLNLRSGMDYSIPLGRKYTGLGGTEKWHLVGLTSKEQRVKINLDSEVMYVVSGIDYITGGSQDFNLAAVNVGDVCHSVLWSFANMEIVPVDSPCEQPLGEWVISTFGKWMIAVGGPTPNFESTLDYFIIPTACFVGQGGDIGKCESQKELAFSYPRDLDCSYGLTWTKNEDAVIMVIEDTNTTCENKGSRLIYLDGRMDIIKSYPIYFRDIWTADGQWLIWEDDIGNWGLYSPYNGGQVRKLGEGIILGFSIVSVP